MKVILTTIGSAGDTLPFIGLGRELRARGHEVVLLVNDHFALPAERAGLRVHSIGTDAEYLAAIENPDIFDARNGFRAIASYVGPLLGTMYRALEAEYEPGHTVIVAHWIDFASRVFQDRHAAPTVTVLLQPVLLRSLIDTPTWQPGPDVNRLPKWAKRALFWAVDRWMVDPMLARPVNALRASVGLRSIHRPLQGWMFSPLLALGMWPEFFAPPRADWPASVRLTGFPLFDTTEAVPEDVDTFLEQGEPPIVFTQGTAMGNARAFFDAAASACSRLGRRGLFMSGFGGPPAPLPTTIHFARFAPLSQILPRCAALVHHGGIGTTGAGLAAGVPQLITPLSHDQPDNAARIKRLGAGDWMLPRQVSAETLATRLRPLLENRSVAERCTELAQQVGASPGVSKSVELIEALSSSNGRDPLAGAARAAARDR